MHRYCMMTENSYIQIWWVFYRLCACVFYRLGAAMVVETRSANVLSVFERTFFNPLCFIQYQNTFASPDQWDQVNYTVCESKTHGSNS